ncbi:DUF4383 domain-containing protein [Neobacillus sp. PS3-34]|uniref:DUF4383 domain-containing protein n=1 Tax=Neobacillus sp. PS3-34 TaxID=3070678 RepID=UPI0027DF9E19|nr:DUF4383 domain-containing protein [Neobacillus sp. PS3-34]WML48388.1 DUF4383 domain-containing protein [Neobacillus sp. PS3-34]
MAKKFARILGVIFVVTGIVGFFFPLEKVFDLTTTHNIVHLATGIIALLVSGSETNSAAFSKIFGFIYLLVAIVGLFTHSFIGIHFLVADNILHFVIAFASIYVGYASSMKQNS